MQIHVCKELFKRRRECVDFCLNCLQQLLNAFTTRHSSRTGPATAAPLDNRECELNGNTEKRGKIVLVHQLRQWEH